MENIYIHIENLLVHNDHVVVPGFGGFILQNKPATLTNSVLTAPCKTIAFNSLLQHTDGLLVVEVSRSEKIAYRQAQEIIDNFVEDINSELKSKKSLKFGNLGEFSVNLEGTLSFQPNVAAQFIPENINFNSISVATKAHKTLHTEYPGKKHFSLVKTMRYAAMIIAVMSLQMVTEKITDSRNQNNSASILDINSFIPKKEIIKDTIQIAEPKIEVQIANDSLYHVVVASLATQEAADEVKNELLNDSFKEAHVLEPRKTYRVAIKSFEEKEDAINYMETLRTTDERFATAWVLCKK